jgi:mRNA interferase MazF
MKRGEIRWYAFGPPDKRRPVLILSRDDVVEHLGEVIVVPATRTIRGLRSELVLTPEDGVPVPCALNFDHISLAQKGRLRGVLCLLPPSRWSEAEAALLAACGFKAE